MCPLYVEKKTIYYKTVWGAFTNRLSFIVTVATRKEIIANEARTLFQAKNWQTTCLMVWMERNVYIYTSSEGWARSWESKSE